MTCKTQYQRNTKDPYTLPKGYKGRQVSIGVKDNNVRFLEVLDEYAEEWEVPRSEAFFRMVKRYNYADISNKPVSEAACVVG